MHNVVRAFRIYNVNNTVNVPIYNIPQLEYPWILNIIIFMHECLISNQSNTFKYIAIATIPINAQNIYRDF